jgi:predicted amidohydrolase
MQGDSPDTVLINGGSTIISPLGEILAGPARAGETVLLAEIDLADRDRSFLDFDPVGHYSRPDIFSLTVNEAPQNGGYSPVMQRQNGWPAGSV